MGGATTSAKVWVLPLRSAHAPACGVWMAVHLRACAASESVRRTLRCEAKCNWRRVERTKPRENHAVAAAGALPSERLRGRCADLAHGRRRRRQHSFIAVLSRPKALRKATTRFGPLPYALPPSFRPFGRPACRCCAAQTTHTFDGRVCSHQRQADRPPPFSRQ